MTHTLAQVDRSELQERTTELLRAEIEFIGNPSFAEGDQELEQLVDEPSANSATSPPPKDLPAHLARLCEADLLTAEQERQLFRQMNYWKFRAQQEREKLNPQRPGIKRITQIERYLAAASRTRDRIIQANMRLVMSVVKKFVTPQNSFDDMLSEGIFSLMQAVDKFDYDRGFRFSTYAYRAIARNAYRSINNRQKESARYMTELDDSALEQADGRCSASMDEQTWARLRTMLSGMMDKLDRREQLIIRCRYALGAHRKVKTFQAIADKLGVSKERVRQLEQRAVDKLRTMGVEAEREESESCFA